MQFALNYLIFGRISMRVIVPMTGNGSRFKKAGFSRLKPFIKVHGRPMIAWVCDMFPNQLVELIIREEHIKKHPYILKELKLYCKNIKIHRVKNWKKKGPAYDIWRLLESDLNLEEDILISYCDFYATWDFNKFIKFTQRNKADGIIPCYSGFHPHLLHPENLYASCRSDKKHKLVEIREKYQTYGSKFEDLTSPGLYYFRTGKLCKDYCLKLIKSEITIRDEFYLSLPYNFMIKDGYSVITPVLVEYFCQWGTPNDLEEYNFWMEKSFIKSL